MTRYKVDKSIYKYDVWKTDWYNCPNCGFGCIADCFSFCPSCGEGLEWEIFDDSR